MRNLKPYDPAEPCVKCGGQDISVRLYHNVHHGWSYAPCPLAGLARPRCCAFEHLCCSCRRCGYQWPRGVLDEVLR